MSRLTHALAVLSILATAYAHAGKPVSMPEPKPEPVSTSSTSASAQASADAAAAAEAAAAANVEAPATATASNDGVSVGGADLDVTHSTRVRALGVNLPGHAGATGVEHCHESRGSLGAFGAGSGGKVTINVSCMKFEQCMQVARFYAEMGRQDWAARQLADEDCGGIVFDSLQEGSALYTPPTVEEPAAPPSCDEHVSRVFEACQTK